MPKKKHKETQAEQSTRFRAEVEKLIAAGELNPTEADEALDRMVRSSQPHSTLRER
jgi:polyhydroxyalkanoate synthesis regulator phasin